MLFNTPRCRALTPELVNTASGLHLHRFAWLAPDDRIGALPSVWNHLVDVQPPDPAAQLLHWTLGGPWFREQRSAGGPLAAEWFAAREASQRLYD